MAARHQSGPTGQARPPVHQRSRLRRGAAEGSDPFGVCDMNSADGVHPQAFASACGITIAVEPAIPEPAIPEPAIPEPTYSSTAADDGTDACCKRFHRARPPAADRGLRHAGQARRRAQSNPRMTADAAPTKATKRSDQAQSGEGRQSRTRQTHQAQSGRDGGGHSRRSGRKRSGQHQAQSGQGGERHTRQGGQLAKAAKRTPAKAAQADSHKTGTTRRRLAPEHARRWTCHAGGADAHVVRWQQKGHSDGAGAARRGVVMLRRALHPRPFRRPLPRRVPTSRPCSRAARSPRLALAESVMTSSTRCARSSAASRSACTPAIRRAPDFPTRGEDGIRDASKHVGGHVSRLPEHQAGARRLLAGRGSYGLRDGDGAAGIPPTNRCPSAWPITWPPSCSGSPTPSS